MSQPLTVPDIEIEMYLNTFPEVSETDPETQAIEHCLDVLEVMRSNFYEEY